MKIRTVYNLMSYPLSHLPWWKRAALRFCRLRVENDGRVQIAYKILFGDVYVFDVTKHGHYWCTVGNTGEYN